MSLESTKATQTPEGLRLQARDIRQLIIDVENRVLRVDQDIRETEGAFQRLAPSEQHQFEAVVTDYIEKLKKSHLVQNNAIVAYRNLAAALEEQARNLSDIHASDQVQQ